MGSINLDSDSVITGSKAVVVQADNGSVANIGRITGANLEIYRAMIS